MSCGKEKLCYTVYMKIKMFNIQNTSGLSQKSVVFFSMKARVVPDVIWRRPSFLFGSFVNFGIVYKISYLLIVNILNIQRQTYLRRKFTEQNLLLQPIQHWITSIHVYKLDPSVSIIDGTKCLETVINPTA